MAMQRADGARAGAGVEATLSVLELLSSGRPMGLRQIAQLTGASKTTVQRVLRTLLETGFVIQDAQSRKYRMGPSGFSLALRILGEPRLRQVATLHMLRLYEKHSFPVYLGALYGQSVIVLDRISPGHGFRKPNLQRSYFPVHATSMGKAILAFHPQSDLLDFLRDFTFSPRTNHSVTSHEEFLDELTKVRQRGYALNWQELSMDSYSIAAPIFDERSGEVKGAIAMHVAAIKDDTDAVRRVSESLRLASREISKIY